jgi:hypothetical protein
LIHLPKLDPLPGKQKRGAGNMAGQNPFDLEIDARFPSGKWLGFFLQAQGSRPGRHKMELNLSFKNGALSGECRDWVGHSLIHGSYSTADGQCHWIKRYSGRHHIQYDGYNEGKGIWGTWEIPPVINSGLLWRGGFHIWPEGMADPTEPELSEEADLPIHAEELAEAVTEREPGILIKTTF